MGKKKYTITEALAMFDSIKLNSSQVPSVEDYEDFIITKPDLKPKSKINKPKPKKLLGVDGFHLYEIVGYINYKYDNLFDYEYYSKILIDNKVDGFDFKYGKIEIFELDRPIQNNKTNRLEEVLYYEFKEYDRSDSESCLLLSIPIWVIGKNFSAFTCMNFHPGDEQIQKMLDKNNIYQLEDMAWSLKRSLELENYEKNI